MAHRVEVLVAPLKALGGEEPGFPFDERVENYASPFFKGGSRGIFLVVFNSEIKY